MALLGSALDLLIAILAFGFLIFIHELGHFIAARWAGIRVLAFALGFGRAIVSYRKGLGWRAGSSEREYVVLRDRDPAKTRATISPTEYRLNWFPFGGYVKMLGQVDGDPTQTSSEPDSFQRCPVWKRMIVISGGVVANIILAGLLFMLVFKVGLKTEPATIGFVAPGSPASQAVVVKGDAAGASGLRAGDEVVLIQGKPPRSFNDLTMGVAMTPRGQPVRMTIQRPGVGTLEMEVRPEEGAQTRLMEIGVFPPQSAVLQDVKTAADRAAFARIVRDAGMPEVLPGMRLVSVEGASDVRGAETLSAASRASGGQAFGATFEGQGRVNVRVQPRAALEADLVPMPGSPNPTSIVHLLGLAPVLAVAPASDATMDRQGLQDGDIFARIGSVEYPSMAEGIAEIRRHKGSRVDVVVLRLQPDGSRTLVKLDPSPTVRNVGKGQLGFGAEDSKDLGTWLAAPPRVLSETQGQTPETIATPAASLNVVPGSRVVAVEAQPVATFTDIREALKAATKSAHESGAAEAEVTLTIAPPLSTDPAAHNTPRTVTWTLSREAITTLHALGWQSPLSEGLFEPEQIRLQAAGPIDAVRMGIAETHRVMMMTYLTFARLADGTVKVEHLKGPVGIAHIGTRIVDRGAIWLLFFMALLSVNLAVINFLPLPVVDGGQFLFLCYEALRGRPAPIAVQNVATLIGLMIIGTMFVIVTFHDILNLFG